MNYETKEYLRRGEQTGEKSIQQYFFCFCSAFIFALSSVVLANQAEASGGDPAAIKPPLLNVIAVRLTPEKPGSQEVFEASFTIRQLSATRTPETLLVEFNGLGNFQVAEGFTNRKNRLPLYHG
ncbi:MAG: hypothetical protein ACOX1X_02930 [Dethiobacteria bacterium]